MRRFSGEGFVPTARNNTLPGLPNGARQSLQRGLPGSDFMMRLKRAIPGSSPISIARHFSSGDIFLAIARELSLRGVDIQPVRTPRLELVSMTPDFMEAVLAGRRAEAEALLGIVLPDEPPDPAVERFLSHRVRQLHEKPEAQKWLARAIVPRDGARIMVGNAGFHGEPGVNAADNPDALEIGYGILPEHRRKGYATEAVTALIAWARTQGVDQFVASVAPDNQPSLAIIHKLGFVRAGEHMDPDDGLEHVFELRG
jgi:ribosomal-protein-alanine N-acetyltransferase